jgi:selenocysteine lyase/cysteine desulfurase
MVGYAADAMRFMGATFDPSALYRFNAIQEMLNGHGLTTARISAHVDSLQLRMLQSISSTALGQAELLNPIDGDPHARFLAFRDTRAPLWCAQLKREGCITDVRGDVLRIGFGLYQDDEDVDALAALIAGLD